MHCPGFQKNMEVLHSTPPPLPLSLSLRACFSPAIFPSQYISLKLRDVLRMGADHVSKCVVANKEITLVIILVH
jgi:hypothetical protein